MILSLNRIESGAFVARISSFRFIELRAHVPQTARIIIFHV
jgi:hypothetical protein